MVKKVEWWLVVLLLVMAWLPTNLLLYTLATADADVAACVYGDIPQKVISCP